MSTETTPRRRGRPPKTDRSYTDTREALIRSGLALLTHVGYLSTGIDAIVKNVNVPKGSFYYYFENKEEYGQVVLEAYDSFFQHKLRKYLADPAQPPLTRLANFVQSAGEGMQKYDFTRGCLVGNLMQESPGLPAAFSTQLMSILEGWQRHVAACLREAMDAGDVASALTPDALAVIFWSGWEGAVMRARLFRSAQPLNEFWDYFALSIRAA